MDLVDRMGDPLDPQRYDWDAARRGDLDPETIFELTYAAEVEWATEATFRSLDINDDPLVRRFLRIWLGQEAAHGELLSRFLGARGTEVTPAHRTRRHRFASERGRVVNRIIHRAVGDDFLAVHMVWGAVNELTTLRFYSLIRRRTDHPVLAELLKDLMAQEALHYAFYRAAAMERLDGNRRGQAKVRWAMTHLWSPVGVGLRSRRDADRLMTGLFRHEPDEVRRIDAAVGSIPGLVGLDLIRGCVDAASARTDPRQASPAPQSTQWPTSVRWTGDALNP